MLNVIKVGVGCLPSFIVIVAQIFALILNRIAAFSELTQVCGKHAHTHKHFLRRI